ncbi:carbohydrate ABC transporter permease [Leptospira interrogans]
MMKNTVGGPRQLSRLIDYLFPLLLNAPSLIAIIFIAIGPIIYAGWISLHNYVLTRPKNFSFVGFANYLEIIASPEFYASFVITLQFTVLVVAATTVFGLAIALLLNQEFPARNFIRAIILIPWAMPPVVNGLMWQWIYDAKVGALNGALFSLGFIDEYRGWLSDPVSAMFALVWADTWNTVPLTVILLLASLQRIPAELYNAARLDGATGLQMFKYITFPWLAQPILIVLILQTMAAIRAFDIIYVLTAGGPAGSTTTLSWRTYLVTFESLNFGMGNAYAYIISIITLTLAVIYFKLLYRRGEFDA